MPKPEQDFSKPEQPNKKPEQIKIALVCDWLTNIGGAEKVLKSLHDMYPSAPIYTSKYDKKGIAWFRDADVRTGWLQIFPTCFRRFLGPLRQSYFSHLDLSSYDIIISVTGAEAKAVKKGNAIHICYCHVPTQYYWQMYDEYLKNPGFGILNPLVRFFFKLFVKPLRKKDYKSAQIPDYFITISSYAQGLIKTYYGRESRVIYPPVDVENFIKKPEKGNYSPRGDNMIITSRQVTWKKIDLAINACKKNNWPLTIIGEGPEHKNLMKLAGSSPFITFKPLMDRDELKKELASAKAYIFPSLEPFGIAPVEALASGCPVIAFGQGGALDYVIDGENGVLFGKQNTASLSQALKKFSKMNLSERKIIQSSLPFDEKYFQTKIRRFVDACIEIKHKKQK